MSKSLADLRAQRPQSRPERSLTVCLAPHLVAEVQQLTEESTRLKPLEADESDTAPRRMGQGEHPRAVEIRERLAALLDEMAEHEGELRVRASRTDGEWRNWANEHPARDEGEPGHDRDQRVSYGLCDSDALLDDLATYAYSWNGEPLGDGEFAALIEPSLGSPDKAEMARAVVSMYESRLDFPQWRTSLSANLLRSRDSSSPAPSASPTADSTAGSPEPSSVVTTVTESKSA